MSTHHLSAARRVTLPETDGSDCFEPASRTKTQTSTYKAAKMIKKEAYVISVQACSTRNKAQITGQRSELGLNGRSDQKRTKYGIQ